MKNNRWRSRLQSIGPLVILAVLLIFGVLSFQYIVTNALYFEVQDKVSRLTTQQEQLSEKRIQRAYGALSVLGQALQSGTSPDALHWLEKQPGLPPFLCVGAVSVQGSLLYGGALPASEKSFLMESFRGHEAMHTLAGGSGTDPQEQGMLLSVPLWQNGHVAGAVYVVLGSEGMEKLLTDSFFDGRGIVFSARQDFQVLVFDRKGDKDLGNLAQDLSKGHQVDHVKALYRKLYAKGAGVERISYGNKSYYLSASALSPLDGWYVCSLVPADQVEKRMQTVIFLTGGGFVILSVLFLAAFWLIGWNNRKKEREILHLAYEDELTGLANWPGMQRQIGVQGIRPGWSLCILDVDEFNTLNSFMGYDFGNRLLLTIAKKMRFLLQPGELACRVRGDRFVLYLDTRQLQERLERLIQEVREGTRAYPVGISCGVCSLSGDGDFSRSYENAILAMKNTKQDPLQDVLFYDEAMGRKSRKKKTLEADFAMALERHELFVVLQPKHYLQKEGWAGCEALIRWNHKELGLVQPDDFVGLLEENGDVGKLDLYILREVCQMIRHWLDAGKKVLPVSVNLSRRHFVSPSLVQDIQEIVEAYEIPYECLEFEITETALSRWDHLLMIKLHQLHARGFRLSIDDFGVGYSSLSALENMPVSTIKLDKSFIRNGMKLGASTLIPDIVVLAHHMGIEVLIEGIETESECALVRQAGCDAVQGFFYAKPMTPEDFSMLVYGGRGE